ncbi:unnamed protein product [Spodoptera exigua]|nr:unnamed protein product [Spodoptera exigua]
MDSCVGVVALGEHRSSSRQYVISWTVRHVWDRGRLDSTAAPLLRRRARAAGGAVESALTPTHTQRALDARRRSTTITYRQEDYRRIEGLRAEVADGDRVSDGDKGNGTTTVECSCVYRGHCSMLEV